MNQGQSRQVIATTAPSLGPSLQSSQRQGLIRPGLLVGLVLGLLPAGCSDPAGQQPSEDMGPTMGMVVSTVGTSPALTNLPQDAAIWVHPTDSTRSRILVTERSNFMGNLYVYDLDGKLQQQLGPLLQPGLVDVERDFMLDGKSVDIAAVAEAGKNAIRLYAIDRDTGVLRDVTGGTTVFIDRVGDAARPGAVGLYRRKSDKSIFAITGAITGPVTNYIYQYKLTDRPGFIDLYYTRSFGDFSTIVQPGENDVKGLLVDDDRGYVYYSDKPCCIRKYAADPDAVNANQELAQFGKSEFMGDRNGLALYSRTDGTGYLLSIDQLNGKSRVLVWKREGEALLPNVHNAVSILDLNADFTDGIEVSSAALGQNYQQGMMVVSNRKDNNFLLYPWSDIAKSGGLK